MTDITYERALRQGAQRMAALLASELPETGAPPSPEFTRRMEPVVQQGARRQSRRSFRPEPGRDHGGYG